MIAPDAMLVICAAVCFFVIGLVAAGAHNLALENARARDRERLQWAAERDADTDAQDLGTVLTGTWDEEHPEAEAWWWRCTRCRELEVSLPPELAGLAALEHTCPPAALAEAQAAAKRQHPAFRGLR